MAKGDSMGFVETMGLVTAIEAADAMVKAARVKVRTVVNADAGLLSVVCEGDLAACKAAVDAGKAAAARVGEAVASNIIARPDQGTDEMVGGYVKGLFEAKAAAKPEARGKKKSKKGK